ncbi:MAG: hypothetical protein GY925_15145, partial [Actinomycetia bacterium]|nr:hypothetical protein [Actinomycetes bacterium]
MGSGAGRRFGVVFLVVGLVASLLAVPPAVGQDAAGGGEWGDVVGRAEGVNRRPSVPDLAAPVDKRPESFDELVAGRFEPLAEQAQIVEVPGRGGVAVFDGLPVSVRVPEEAGRRSAKVAVSTAPAGVARVLSPVGVAFGLEVSSQGGPALPNATDSLPGAIGRSASQRDSEPSRDTGGRVDDVGDGVTVVDPKTGLTVVMPEASRGGGDSNGRSGVVDEFDGEMDSAERGAKGAPVPDRGGSGWLIEFTPGDVGLDTAGLAELGARLEFVLWSACDDTGQCEARRSLPSTFDEVRGVLVAEVPRQVLAGMARVDAGRGPVEGPGGSVLASGGSSPYVSVNGTVSGPSGDFGDAGFGSPTSGAVSTQTGSATSSYSFDLPLAVGPVPSLGLSYDSGSVDGLNTSINTQPGPAGLGWSLSRASITRQTATCDSASDAAGQTCYADGVTWDDGFSLSMPGSGGRLAKTTTTGTASVLGTSRAYTEYELEFDPTLRIRRFQFDTQSRGVTAMVSNPAGDGGWSVDTAGVVVAFGAVSHHGDLAAYSISNIADIETTPSGDGYWLVGTDGGVFAFGDAGFHGSLPGWSPPIVVNNIRAMAATPNGGGYWLMAWDGAVYAFGNAQYHGNAMTHFSSPFYDIEPHGYDGYWILRKDGSVYTFGSAPYFGNGSSTHARSIISTPTGNGYWVGDFYGRTWAWGDADPAGSATYPEARESASELVADYARSGSDGMFIQELYGTVIPHNGAPWTEASHTDTRGSFWEVTTTDGTAYYFGLGHEPGSMRPTNSVKYVPVYDPTTHNSSSYECWWTMCDTATGWGLDRIQDTSDNVASLFYEPEMNWYHGQVASSTNRHRGYIRANVLTSLEYGFAAGDEHDDAPFVAAIGYTTRCKETTPGSGTCEQQNGVDAYPDTPTDLGCIGTNTCAQTSPSFYTYWRLHNVTTRVLNATQSGYDDVKKWSFVFDYPDPDPGATPDDSVRKLWLNDIIAASADGADALPRVVFSPTMLDNRVNHPTGVSAMTMPRLGTILNEFGGLTTFNYGQSHPYASVSACSGSGATNIRPP